MTRINYLFIIFSLVVAFSLLSCTLPKKEWGDIRVPTANPSEIYGGYSAGCLDGAVQLTERHNNNFLIMRPSRHRMFAHPQLIDFLESHANDIGNSNLGILAIGDLSQARGGPMSSGHASHQAGLDADIWFKRFNSFEAQVLKNQDRESYSAVSMVDNSKWQINKNWDASQALVLKKAASDERVERIFVNFAIKKQLCQSFKGQTWLSKIRPWWGHQYHYHVRLTCPQDSPNCKAQKRVSSTDGCDKSLNWWFSEDAHRPKQVKSESIEKQKPKELILPKQCHSVLNAQA